LRQRGGAWKQQGGINDGGLNLRGNKLVVYGRGAGAVTWSQGKGKEPGVSQSYLYGKEGIQKVGKEKQKTKRGERLASNTTGKKAFFE